MPYRETNQGLWRGFPGRELVKKGVHDLHEAAVLTAEAALVLIASTRLKNAGINIPSTNLPSGRSPESLLFESLYNTNLATAYSSYRSLKATLDSFIRCLENENLTSASRCKNISRD